jgi:hypothetical protein
MARQSCCTGSFVGLAGGSARAKKKAADPFGPPLDSAIQRQRTMYDGF